MSIFVSSSPQFTTTATTNVPFHHSQHHRTTPTTPILNPFTTANHRYVPRSRLFVLPSQDKRGGFGNEMEDLWEAIE
ncbi:hypothetical protein L1887_32223 [Cichorium endivia]|nr:hypothetical protein L1887_32223 [Cichorium endivia]